MARLKHYLRNHRGVAPCGDASESSETVAVWAHVSCPDCLASRKFDFSTPKKIMPEIDDAMVERVKRELKWSEAFALNPSTNRDLDQRIRDLLRAAFDQS